MILLDASVKGLPDRVQKLVHLGDARREGGLGTFLDDEMNLFESDLASKGVDPGSGLAGIAVFRDLRD
jgi:hypothetical protein